MKLPEKNPAKQLFKQFCDAYKKHDLNALLKMMTSDINMWGSGIDEYRVGLLDVETQLKRDWSQSEKAEIEVVSFVPAPEEAVWSEAICHAKVTIDGLRCSFPDLRGTIIVAKEKGEWKIAHMHASFPDYRNADNGSFPVKA